MESKQLLVIVENLNNIEYCVVIH